MSCFVLCIRDKGRKVVPVLTPDRITNWVVTAFAVHPQLGLAVATAPAEVSHSKTYSGAVLIHVIYPWSKGCEFESRQDRRDFFFQS